MASGLLGFRVWGCRSSGFGLRTWVLRGLGFRVLGWRFLRLCGGLSEGYYYRAYHYRDSITMAVFLARK